MASHRISVRRVLELGVQVSWQEAVAVVHEVAILSVVNASRNGVPSRIDADSCILTRRGDVELPQTTDAARPDAPLQLLRELLTGRETPADLEALAYGTPSENITDDLAMFSRPNGRSEISNLAMRALEAEEEMAALGITPPALLDAVQPAVAEPRPEELPPLASVSPMTMEAEAEFAKLRDQASSARPAPQPQETAAPRQRVPAWVLRSVAAAGLVIAITAGWWAWSIGPPTPATASGGPFPTPQALAALELDPAWHTVGRREADIDLGFRASAPRPAATATEGSLAVLDSPAPIAGSTDGLGSNTASTPAAGIAASPTASTEDAKIDALFADDSVYSMASEGVRPPLMLFPRMPKSAFPPPSAAIDGPYFEVLVDQQGIVEAVRLRGREQPGQTFYRARMMLSAAKAWQFEPARINDRPVRYIVRVLAEP
jgi:hypothetical protein